MNSFWLGRRVLVLSSSYPGSSEDGRAWFVHEGARALAEAGAEVLVCTPAWRGTARREVIRDVRVERFGYMGRRILPIAGEHGIPENLRAHPARALTVPSFLAGFIAATRRLVARFRPQTLIGHWLLPTALAVRGCGLPALLLAHGSDVRWLATMPGGRKLGAYLTRGSAVIPTSDALATTLERIGLVPRRTIPVGIRLPPLPELSRLTARSGEEPARLCSFGRWVPGKGWPELLEAVAASPRTHLTLGGFGPLEPFIRRRAAQIGPRVKVVGPVVGAEAKRHFFAEHDAFVFAGTRGAREDNLPVTVLESLAHGVPVVATRVGALAEVIGQGEGWLVEPGTFELGERLSVLTRGQCRARTRAARARAESRSWTRVIDQLADVAASV